MPELVLSIKYDDDDDDDDLKYIRIYAQFVSVSAASVHPHHLCRMTFNISRSGFKSCLKSWLFERAFT